MYLMKRRLFKQQQKYGYTQRNELIKTTKRVLLSTFFSFVAMLQFKVCISIWIFVLGINDLKIDQF